MMTALEIVAGYEERELAGYQVCSFSAIRRTSRPLRFIPLMEHALRYNNLYWREHRVDSDGQTWDVPSDAPMSTSFANSRFLTPWLVSTEWALFCDFSDMLFLADPAELFSLADDRYAVQVVKHQYEVSEATKMDGQQQTVYGRKNWSSVILWNVTHPANTRLTLDMVNILPGRDLHQFCWLSDEEIGELPKEWNYLVGVDPSLTDIGTKPKLLHYTLGIPTMEGYEHGPFSQTWLDELAIMDSTRARCPPRS